MKFLVISVKASTQQYNLYFSSICVEYCERDNNY